MQQGKRGGRAIETENEATRRIAIRISVLARLLRGNFDRQVSVHGVTRSQWQMIVVVANRPGSTQRSIAEILEMSEASAGRLIDRLCADGLLTRRERDDDRRARAIHLTEAAEPLLAKLSEAGMESEAMLFKGFDEAELSQLEGYIDRLYANVAR